MTKTLEDVARTARWRKKAAENALLIAAEELATATKGCEAAEHALAEARKRAPLEHWTRGGPMDRFQYVRSGYGLVREVGAGSQPWRVQKGKVFITDRLGRIRSFLTAEAAAQAANTLIEDDRA